MLKMVLWRELQRVFRYQSGCTISHLSKSAFIPRIIISHFNIDTHYSVIDAFSCEYLFFGVQLGIVWAVCATLDRLALHTCVLFAPHKCPPRSTLVWSKHWLSMGFKRVKETKRRKGEKAKRTRGRIKRKNERKGGKMVKYVWKRSYAAGVHSPSGISLTHYMHFNAWQT